MYGINSSEPWNLKLLSNNILLKIRQTQFQDSVIFNPCIQNKSQKLSVCFTLTEHLNFNQSCVKYAMIPCDIRQHSPDNIGAITAKSFNMFYIFTEIHHAIKSIYLKYIPISRVVCIQQSPKSFLKHFQDTIQEPYNHSVIPHSLLLSIHPQPNNLYPVFTDCIFQLIQMNKFIQCVTSVVWLLSLNLVYSGHLCCSICLNFIPFMTE